MSEFSEAYKKYAEREELNPDPFSPLHFYDYTAYWDKYGKFPEKKGEHLDSRFKILGHPNLIVRDKGKWIDTRTGEPSTHKLVEANMEANARAHRENE